MKITSYEASGKRKEITSFFDKAEGAASQLEVMTAATVGLASENRIFRRQLEDLKNKSTFSNQ